MGLGVSLRKKNIHTCTYIYIKNKDGGIDVAAADAMAVFAAWSAHGWIRRTNRQDSATDREIENHFLAAAKQETVEHPSCVYTVRLLRQA